MFTELLQIWLYFYKILCISTKLTEVLGAFEKLAELLHNLLNIYKDSNENFYSGSHEPNRKGENPINQPQSCTR